MPCVYAGGIVTLSSPATPTSPPTSATSASVTPPISLSGLDSTTDPTNEYNIKIYAYTRTQILHYTTLTAGCVFRLEYGIYSTYDKYTHLFTSPRVGSTNSDNIVELSSILQHISKYNMNTFISLPTTPLLTSTTSTTDGNANTTTATNTHTTSKTHRASNTHSASNTHTAPTTKPTPTQSIFNLIHSYGILFPTPYFDTFPLQHQVRYIYIHVYIYIHIL